MKVNLSLFIPYFAAAAFAIPKSHPTTAVVSNQLTGSGQIILEYTMNRMEEWSGSAFLHGKEPDLIISVRYGKLPNEKQLAVASLRTGYCDITVHEDLAPDHPKYDKSQNMPLVLIHEIGHCFGLPHDNDPSSVMFYASMPWKQLNQDSFRRFFEKLNRHRGVR